MPRARSGVAALAALLLGVGCLAAGLVGPAVSAAAPAPLNVVLVVTDDQTMESVARMPHVSAQPWVSFGNAFIENALCCPSRASILQGRHDTHTGVVNNATAKRFDPTLALPVWLQGAGYRTGLFGKYLNGYDGPAVPPGWDVWQVPYTDAQYRQYGYPMSNNGVREERGSRPQDYQVDLLAERTSAFVASSARSRRPFFAMVTPTATHSPWVASPSRTGASSSAAVTRSPAFNEADVTDKPRWVRQLAPTDPAQMDAERRREWDAAASVDDAMARIDRALSIAGVLDSTVVMFLTDNGYAFGDHRWEVKRCPYEACMRTPLLVRYPGEPGGTDGHLISNIDIAPTIAQIAGATPTTVPDGRSILPFVLSPVPSPPVGDPSWRTAVLFHWSGGNAGGVPGRIGSVPQYWGLRTRYDKYVELDTGEREYYDLRTDPYELVNRSTDPAVAQRVAALRRQLVTAKDAAGASASAFHPWVGPPGDLGPDLD